MQPTVHMTIPARPAQATCDVLVLSAHPDDAEFGAAGTVIRWIDEGRRVVYAIATDGDKGTSDRSLTPEALAVIRREEQTRAAASVGVGEVVYMGYPDQGLEETPALRKDVVRLLRIYRPHTLVTSDPYRRYLWHRDGAFVQRLGAGDRFFLSQGRVRRATAGEDDKSDEGEA